MRNIHRAAKPGRETGEHDPDLPSKSARKAEVESLQDLGERLIGLPAERLKRVPLPENLRDAVMDARRFTAHGAIRRQRQYIGKLMRNIDTEPIAAAIKAFDGDSAEDTARLHRREKLRDQLIEDEGVLTELTRRFPHANVQLLRQLRRNVVKERTENKPARSYRLLFQELKALETPPANPSGVTDNFLQADAPAARDEADE